MIVGLTLGPSPGAAQSVKPDDRIIQRVHDRFNLDSGQVVTPHFAGGVAGTGIVVEVPVDGATYTLRLAPHSVRSRDYRLLAQMADGSLVDVEPGPITTLRGRVEEIEGSLVAASLSERGLRAMILLPDNSRVWIEPIGPRLAGAAADGHVVYRDQDVQPTNHTCGVWAPPNASSLEATEPSVAAVGETLFIAELAIDADYEYVSDFRSLSEMEEQINLIINTVNVQYERDVGIKHAITTIIARTTEPDPYSTADPDALLSQFRFEWENFQSNVPRDLAQLFTGKNLTGSAIGIAWRGSPQIKTVCDQYGYSVVESNCSFTCGNLATKTDLSAHELGHNWSAGHCTCSGWTMNSSLSSANRFHATFSIPAIMDYRDSRICLDEGDTLRRLILSAAASVVAEGETLAFTAKANFRFAGDDDVTSLAAWSIDPPTSGVMDADGLFTPSDVDASACVTVTASYMFDGVTRTDSRVITVIDVDAPLAIVATDPPDGAIDARRPLDLPTGSPLGWTTLEITLTDHLCSVVPADFLVVQEGGTGEAPTVSFVDRLVPTRFLVTFSRPIEPGAWTIVTHVGSGLSTRIGFLPGDVNGDGTSDGNDILALMDALAGVGDALPLWAADVDRSGQTVPPDLLELIDLLEGTGSSPGWRGASLP